MKSFKIILITVSVLLFSISISINYKNRIFKRAKPYFELQKAKKTEAKLSNWKNLAKVKDDGNKSKIHSLYDLKKDFDASDQNKNGLLEKSEFCKSCQISTNFKDKSEVYSALYPTFYYYESIDQMYSVVDIWWDHISGGGNIIDEKMKDAIIGLSDKNKDGKLDFKEYAFFVWVFVDKTNLDRKFWQLYNTKKYFKDSEVIFEVEDIFELEDYNGDGILNPGSELDSLIRLYCNQMYRNCAKLPDTEKHFILSVLDKDNDRGLNKSEYLRHIWFFIINRDLEPGFWKTPIEIPTRTLAVKKINKEVRNKNEEINYIHKTSYIPPPIKRIKVGDRTFMILPKTYTDVLVYYLFNYNQNLFGDMSYGTRYTLQSFFFDFWSDCHFDDYITFLRRYERIWQIVDHNKDGKLEQKEFKFAMRTFYDKKYYSTFIGYDSDNDEFLNKKEMYKFFALRQKTDLGFKKDMSDQTKDDVISLCDKDGDQKLNLNEFKYLYSTFADKNQNFSTFDRNSDSFLDKNESYAYFNINYWDLGFDDPISDKKKDGLIVNYDANQDGKLDENEFKEMLLKSKRKKNI